MYICNFILYMTLAPESNDRDPCDMIIIYMYALYMYIYNIWK